MSVGTHPIGASYRVVIADDDVDIRELVEIAVARAGIELVAAAGDGKSALDAIRSHVPDLAILDVAMPELSGLDVVRAMRTDDSLDGVRVLLLSASVDEATKAVGISAGADWYFPKPFSPRELSAWLSIGREEQ